MSSSRQVTSGVGPLAVNTDLEVTVDASGAAGGAGGPTDIFVTTPKGGSTAAPARPTGVSVQVNGENVTFPNASPAVINGRTMVPMRAVLEALGATVDYDGETGTVQARLGDVTLTHVIGTDAIQTAWCYEYMKKHAAEKGISLEEIRKKRED